MYFPGNFDLKKARILADLVDQAYLQFQACEKKESWNLQGNYDLITEINYKGPQSKLMNETRMFFEKEIKAILKSAGRTKTDTYTGLPIGFILRKHGTIFIIFRGTMTPMEWLRNLEFDLKQYPDKKYGNVHEGFLIIFNSLKNSIAETLLKEKKIRRIMIAGHSLGGAIATLLTPFIYEKFPGLPISIYTYGSPRVGDSGFAEEYNRLFSKNTFRIANSSDLVVSVPFPARFMGMFGGPFTHIDTPVDFTTQLGDLESNHSIHTYAEALASARQPFRFRLFFSRFFRF